MISFDRVTPSDTLALWEMIRDEDAHIFDLTFDPNIQNIEEMRVMCSHLSEVEWAWTIRASSPNPNLSNGPNVPEVVGACTLMRGKGPQAHVAELGGWLDPDFQGVKIGRTAVTFMLEFGRQHGLLRIESRPWAENVGACRVLESAGMLLESVRKNSIMRGGNLLDEKVYVWLADGPREEVPCPGQQQSVP